MPDEHQAVISALGQLCEAVKLLTAVMQASVELGEKGLRLAQDASARLDAAENALERRVGKVVEYYERGRPLTAEAP